jgi:hypothetical protein
MGPLLVNRTYCFKFDVISQLSGPPLHSFRDTASASVLQVLDRIETGNLTEQQSQQLQTDLANAVRQAAAGIRVNAAPGSLFEAGAKLPTFAAAVLPFLQAQRDLWQLRENITTDIQRTIALDRAGLVNDEVYQRLSSAAVPATAPRSGLESLNASATLAAKYSAMTSEAFDPTAGMPRPAGWRAADAELVRKNIEQKITDLTSIKLLFNAINVPTNDRFRRALNLTAADAQHIPLILSAISQLAEDLQGLEVRVNDIGSAVERRDTALHAAVNQVVASLDATLLVMATTIQEFTTHHDWYISLDLGLALAPVIAEVFPYVGMNVYFRPVNKAAPLSSFHGHERLARSLSAMIGLTYANDLTKTGQRTTLWADRNVTVGAGVRITDSLRFDAGVVIFKAQDVNPLISNQSLAATPFIAFAADIDVVGLFRQFGKGLSG